MLDNLHKSILWIVRMSLLHDFCRAWFRVTEGRTCKCIRAVPTCCGPLRMQIHSVCHVTCCDCERTPVTQRECRERCSNGNEPLVTPTVVMFTLFDFTGKLPGAAVWTVNALFLYLQFSHAFFLSLLMLVSIKAFFLSLSLFLSCSTVVEVGLPVHLVS